MYVSQLLTREGMDWFQVSELLYPEFPRTGSHHMHDEDGYEYGRPVVYLDAYHGFVRETATCNPARPGIVTINAHAIGSGQRLY